MKFTLPKVVIRAKAKGATLTDIIRRYAVTGRHSEELGFLQKAANKLVARDPDIVADLPDDVRDVLEDLLRQRPD